MNVGKDPFPRDEVTGLAAFEHLEPVGTVSVISEKSRETPVLTGSAAVSGENAATSNSNAEPVTRPRGDATLPLDLSAMPHWAGARSLPEAEPEDSDVEADELDDVEEAAAASAKPKSALDAMFEKSAGLDDWEDEDEATRVHSRPAGRTPGSDGELDMQWDDADEPPTETLPFSLLEEAPIAARLDLDQDQDHDLAHDLDLELDLQRDHGLVAAANEPGEGWNSVDEDKTAHFLGPRGATSIRSATPTIRTTTPPLHLQNTLHQPAPKALNGGRPSPFPATLSAHPTPTRTASITSASSPDLVSPYDHSAHDLDDDDDDDFDSAFKNLVPLPPPQLPEPQPQLQRQPRPRVSTPAPTPSVVVPEREGLAREGVVPERFIDALKAGHRPSVVIAAGGAIGLIALVIIARAIALTTSVGTAVLEVSPADAQVQVDGKAVAGTGSPYSVSELKAGSHELQVTKRGYNDYHGSFAVSAGQSTKLPVIELAPNLLDVGFSVRSAPPGATVWLDGELTEAVTPAKLTGIKPGIHRLALKHEGFSDYELQMFVPEATVLQLPAAELVAVAGVDAEPANGRRRARVGSSRTASSSHLGSSELQGAVSARHVSTAYAARSSSRHDDAEDTSASDAAASGKTGTLRLNSRPWAQVSVDGRQVGNTPQSSLQLSAGKHKLLLVNPQLGVSKNVTVTIKAGETLTQVVNLAE